MNFLDRFLSPVRDARDVARQRAALAVRGKSGPGWFGASLIGLAAGALGAGVAFLLDPARGRARRARLADQGAATVRRAGRRGAQVARRVRSDAAGKIEAMREGDAMPRPTDDATVTDRVMSEVFRDPDLPKGSVSVNVERGIVVLRGEVPSDDVRHQLADRVERIEGVWSVRNLLHLPGEPARTADEVVSA